MEAGPTAFPQCFTASIFKIDKLKEFYSECPLTHHLHPAGNGTLVAV